MPFNPDNVIGLADLDTPIYRIFPLMRFEQLMKSRELVLVRPTSWEDHFEGFLLKARAVIHGENVGLGRLLNKLYGQSWMMCPDSEAMWKLYSFPERLPQRWFHRAVFRYNRWLNGLPVKHEGVKVRTTARRLFQSFYDSSSEFRDLCYFMGRVEYWPVQGIDAFMADSGAVAGQLLDQTGKGHARMMMIKRDAFAHEQEIRIVFIANRDDFDETVESLYRFPVDPDQMFDEVALDPRLSPQERADTESRIRSYGFTGNIVQSQVGAHPAHVVHLNV